MHHLGQNCLEDSGLSLGPSSLLPLNCPCPRGGRQWGCLGQVRDSQTVGVGDAGRGTQSSWHEARRNLAREWPLRKRFCGGGPAPEVRDLVAGICLSALGDAEQVAQLLKQDWVESWNGWAEMEADTRDVVAMAVAERFMRIAGANVPARMMSNRQRMQELEEEGLVLRVASPHGVNNCLIDALLLL